MTDQASRIRAGLHTIDTHYPATLTAASRATGSHAAASSSEPPLPVATHIMAARDTCRRRLEHWATRTINGRDLHTEHLAAGDIHALTEMLTRHADWLGQHPDAAFAAADIQASARDLKGIAMTHRRGFTPLGPCPLLADTTGEPAPCTGTLRAYPNADPYCDQCLTSGTKWWWQRATLGVDPAFVNTLTAAQLVDVIHQQFGAVISQITIRVWAHRGIIEAIGTDSHGRALFDRVDTLYLLSGRAVLT